ncbi:cytochrome P450 [Gorgonomyces haynaldii]|nr:cytochrome P450 [Gorgonomyces haynaldii]
MLSYATPSRERHLIFMQEALNPACNRVFAELKLPMFFWLLIPVLTAVVFYFWVKSDKHPDIPTFEGHWLFGMVPDILKLKKDRQAHQFFKRFIGLRLSKFRGLFGKQAFIVADPELAKQVLMDHEHFTRDTRFQDAAIDLMPYALFAIPGGDTWKTHRKLLQPGFGPVHLKHALDATESLSSTLLSHIQTLADKGEPIDIHGAVNALALDLLGHVAFNTDFKSLLSYINGKESPAKKATDGLSSFIDSRFSIPSLFWPYLGYPKNGPGAKEIVGYFDSLVAPLVQERHKQIQDGTIDQKEWKMDVLQRLLLADDRMSAKEIRDEIIGFIFAGHETTANSITSIVYELVKNPEIQEKLHQDLVKHYNDNEPLTPENLSRSKYLEYVIKEGQRIHSTVGGSLRETIKPVTLDGHKFDKGVRFTVLVYALHADPALWEEPEKFNPDRFEKPIVPGSFMPFGDGQMNCIGQKMAMIEMKVVLIRLLLAFKLELVPKQQLVYRSTVTLGLKDGLLIQCIKRQ